MFPPYRPLRAGAGAGLNIGGSSLAAAGHVGGFDADISDGSSSGVNIGGSSSAAASRAGGIDGVFFDGSSSGVGGGVRQRGNSATVPPSRRIHRSNTTLPGGPR